MDKLTRLAEHFVSHMPTWIFTFMVIGFAYYVIKLHVSAEHKDFNLARMFTHPDGTLDREGMILSVVFGVSTYAFFHLMFQKPDLFLTYAPWYCGFWLAYIGFRMKTRLPGPMGDATQAGQDALPPA